MRRTLSIFLILLFWLGPLAALLPGGEDGRLPVCCRRHGVHHCSMSAGAMAVSSSGDREWKGPATCPAFPGSTYATATNSQALTSGAVSMPALFTERYSRAAGGDAARISQIRTRAGRGPPNTSLA